MSAGPTPAVQRLDAVRPRDIRLAGGFAWQSKAALLAIRQGCQDYGSALAVYLALTVVASDKEAEQFTTTHQWLASLSGFSQRTVRERLQDLKRLGLVFVDTQALRAPCRYRLAAFGAHRQTSGNGCPTFGNGEAPPLPTSEEQKNRRMAERTPTTSERISIEGELKRLRRTEQDLRHDMAEEANRIAFPGKVRELDEVRGRIATLEGRLEL